MATDAQQFAGSCWLLQLSHTIKAMDNSTKLDLNEKSPLVAGPNRSTIFKDRETKTMANCRPTDPELDLQSRMNMNGSKTQPGPSLTLGYSGGWAYPKTST